MGRVPGPDYRGGPRGELDRPVLRGASDEVHLGEDLPADDAPAGCPVFHKRLQPLEPEFAARRVVNNPLGRFAGPFRVALNAFFSQECHVSP